MNKTIETMSDENWNNIQEKTGDDILGIVMDFRAGRVSAGDTMDRVALHCDCAYMEGVISHEP